MSGTAAGPVGTFHGVCGGFTLCAKPSLSVRAAALVGVARLSRKRHRTRCVHRVQRRLGWSSPQAGQEDRSRRATSFAEER